MITREPEAMDPPINLFARIGRTLMLHLRETGRAVLMLLEATWYLPTVFKPRMARETTSQMYVAGIKSLGVITVVALLLWINIVTPAPMSTPRTGVRVNDPTICLRRSPESA